MTHRTPIVGGNWKMNTDLASAVELAEGVVAGCAELVQHCDVVVYPPFPYLQAVGRALGHSGILLGAQDVYHEANGAFTGEVSAEMLVDLNVAMVICGHSERRHILGEDDGLVNLKVQAALDSSLMVTLCVGETLDQREAGQTAEVNIRQLKAGLEGVPAEQMRQVVIAYEPVWAIGTGKYAKLEDAQAVRSVIRDTVAELFDDSIANSTRIQYGGSVKANNARELATQPFADGYLIDGFLVGGVSLKCEEFCEIVSAVAYRDARG